MTTENLKIKKEIDNTWRKYTKALDGFRFNEALGAIWELIGFCDGYIERERPWEEKEKSTEVINDLLCTLGEISELLKPFLPETAKRIAKQLETKISKPLFPKL